MCIHWVHKPLRIFPVSYLSYHCFQVKATACQPSSAGPGGGARDDVRNPPAGLSNLSSLSKPLVFAPSTIRCGVSVSSLTIPPPRACSINSPLAFVRSPVSLFHTQPSFSHIHVIQARSSLSVGRTRFHSGSNGTVDTGFCSDAVDADLSLWNCRSPFTRPSVSTPFSCFMPSFAGFTASPFHPSASPRSLSRQNILQLSWAYAPKPGR